METLSAPITYTTGQVPGLIGLACSSDFHFADHIHNGHVIWLNSGGGEHFTLHGRCEILQPGEISIIEPGVVHSNFPYEGSDRYLRSLYLEPAFWKYLEKMLCGKVDGNLNFPTLLVKDNIYWQRLLRLHQSIISRQDGMVIEDYIVTLFADLFKITNRNTKLDKDKVKSGKIDTVMEYMHENISEPLSLNDLAEIADCTSYHIIRLFKKQYGMSPHAYLVQLRLEKARQLIDEKWSIVDAAIQAGFSDQSHLTRKFRNRYGITPGKYLENVG